MAKLTDDQKARVIFDFFRSEIELYEGRGAVREASRVHVAQELLDFAEAARLYDVVAAFMDAQKAEG